MGRPSRDREPAHVEMDAAFACRWLPRVLLILEPESGAREVREALNAVRGETQEKRAEGMWRVLEGYGLAERGERFLAARWRDHEELIGRLSASTERTSA